MENLIRSEEPHDVAAIRRVEELAFGRPEEADLVDLLRRSCPEQISLVAELEFASNPSYSPIISPYSGAPGYSMACWHLFRYSQAA